MEFYYAHITFPECYRNSIVVLQFHYITRILLCYWNTIVLHHWKSIPLLEFCYVTEFLLLIICLPNKKYICDQRCERTDMATKCKIFVAVTWHLISSSIVYRYTCAYNFKSYWHRCKKQANKHISGKQRILRWSLMLKKKYSCQMSIIFDCYWTLYRHLKILGMCAKQGIPKWS